MRASGTVLTLLLAACGASAAEQSDSYFPIWGDEARARGYSIPLPYGVNLSYMNIRQDIMVDSITFSGLKLGQPSHSQRYVRHRCRAHPREEQNRKPAPLICGSFRFSTFTGWWGIPAGRLSPRSPWIRIRRSFAVWIG